MTSINDECEFDEYDDDLCNTLSDTSSNHFSQNSIISSDEDDEIDVFESINFEEDNEFYRQPIYDGGPISVEESMLVVLSLSLKHNLTDTCISDILKAIQLHFLPKNAKKVSLYHIQKFFGIKKDTYVKHYYCTKCSKASENYVDICDGCKQSYTQKYFAKLSIIDQLHVILNKNGFLDAMKHRYDRKNKTEDCIEELYDGILYREEFENNFCSNDECIFVSFTWCTDGVQIFKSSKLSIWPFYLRINELPFKLRIRRENTILAGLWFSQSKPDPNLFLKSFENELDSLYHGIHLKFNNSNAPQKIRAILLCGTCDLPAKSLFLNITQFNGKFGCPSCEYEGVSISTITSKSIVVFPYVDRFVPRRLEETLEFAQQALRNKINKKTMNEKTSVKGIKGPCFLSNLMPDYIKGTAIDVMHAVFEGVTKKLLYLWIDSSFSSLPFSIRPMLNEVDKLLLNIKPPKFVHRMPTSIEQYYNWKASELKCWLLYYSPPLMKEFMRPNYFNHYILFVSAIATLSGDSISPDNLIQARLLLKKFVKEFESNDFYGIRFCSLNVHQLLHLVDNVEMLGPTWVHSCFSFENINGQLIRNVHGTTDVESQIIKSHLQILKFSSKLSQLEKGPVLDFISNYKRQVTINESINGYYSVGNYRKLLEWPEDIEELECTEEIGTSIRQYFRLLKDGMLYVSDSYRNDLTTNSSYVKIFYKEKYCFGKIIYYLKFSNCNCEGDICICKGNHFAVINPILIRNPFKAGDSQNEIQVHHIHEFQSTTHIILVSVMNLITPVILIQNSSTSYIATPVNKYECE